MGKYTERELNDAFNIQFYGEPVNPGYNPNFSTFFDNGDYFIFAPPDTYSYTYLYGFCAAPEATEVMENIYY